MLCSGYEWELENCLRADWGTNNCLVDECLQLRCLPPKRSKFIQGDYF